MNVVSIQLARVVLGLLAMFFAYALARNGMRLYNAGRPLSKAVTWVLRTAVALIAIFWTRGFDLVGIVMLGLTAASFALGIYLENRPHRTEETHLFTEK